MSTLAKYVPYFRHRSSALSTSQSDDKAKASEPLISREQLFGVGSTEDDNFTEPRREIHKIFQAVREKDQPKERKTTSRFRVLTTKVLPNRLSNKFIHESQDELELNQGMGKQQRWRSKEKWRTETNLLFKPKGRWKRNDSGLQTYARSTAYDPDAQTLRSSVLSDGSCPRLVPLPQPASFDRGTNSPTISTRKANSKTNPTHLRTKTTPGKHYFALEHANRDGYCSLEDISSALEQEMPSSCAEVEAAIECYHTALAEICLVNSVKTLKGHPLLSNRDWTEPQASGVGGLSGHFHENTSSIQGSFQLNVSLENTPIKAEGNPVIHTDLFRHSAINERNDIVTDGASEIKRDGWANGESRQLKTLNVVIDQEQAKNDYGKLQARTSSISRLTSAQTQRESSMAVEYPTIQSSNVQVPLSESNNVNPQAESVFQSNQDIDPQFKRLKGRLFARRDLDLSSDRPRNGSVFSNTQDPNREDASHAWERAIQAHVFEQSSRRSGSGASRQGRRSVSPGVNALRLQRSIKPRVTLTAPSFTIIDYSDARPTTRRVSHRESPTASGTNLRQRARSSPGATTFRSQKWFSSWSRFPSHSREERNGSAGVDDQVSIFDFALIPLLEGAAEAGRCKQGIAAGEHENILRRWKRKFQIHLSDWYRYDKGFRSSVSTSGLLSHPELEILPPLMQAFRSEIPARSAPMSLESREIADNKSTLFSGFKITEIPSHYIEEPLNGQVAEELGGDDGERVSPHDPIPRGPIMCHSYTLLHPNDALGRCIYPRLTEKSSIDSFRTAIETLPAVDEGLGERLLDSHSSQEHWLEGERFGVIQVITEKPSWASFHTALERVHAEGGSEGDQRCPRRIHD